MARPPSIRRPTLTVVSREVERILKKQARAQERLTRALKANASEEEVAQLEDKAALTEAERETLEVAAKVAALLEKTKETDEPEGAPKTEAERDAALKRLEGDGPEAPRIAPSEDDGA